MKKTTKKTKAEIKKFETVEDISVKPVEAKDPVDVVQVPFNESILKEPHPQGLTIHDILKHAYVISNGGPRLEQFKRTFTACGFPVDEIKVWDACMLSKDGKIGCSISHYSIIRHALEDHLPWVVVFEDDATPSDDALDNVVKEFNTRDEACRCIALGWSAASDEDKGRDLSQHRLLWGAHAYAMFGDEAYREYMKVWDENCFPPDYLIQHLTNSRLAEQNNFAQHTPVTGALNLPIGWTVGAEMESVFNGEINDRYQKAKAEVAKIRSEKAIHVAYTIDVQGGGAQQFIDQLLVSVASIKETMNPNSSIVVHIIYGSMSAELMNRLMNFNNDVFKVEFRHISDADLNYMQTLTKHDPRSNVRSWGGIVFARMWLPLFVSEASRCIYLDSDTMVRKPLDELWNMDMQGNLIAMNWGSVYEYGYNSGVILMDCNAIRAVPNLFANMKAFLDQNAKQYYCPDQTAINKFYEGKILALDRKFNHPPTIGEVNPLTNDAVIWHWYNGGGKPTRNNTDDYARTVLVWNNLLVKIP